MWNRRWAFRDASLVKDLLQILQATQTSEVLLVVVVEEEEEIFPSWLLLRFSRSTRSFAANSGTDWTAGAAWWIDTGDAGLWNNIWLLLVLRPMLLLVLWADITGFIRCTPSLPRSIVYSTEFGVPGDDIDNSEELVQVLLLVVELWLLADESIDPLFPLLWKEKVDVLLLITFDTPSVHLLLLRSGWMWVSK